MSDATRRTHSMYKRLWACDLHRGELKKPIECKHFEIGLPRTASRSVTQAVRQMGVRATHGFGGCKQCKDDWVFRHLQGRIDLDVYRGYKYCGQIALVHWEQLAEERPKAKFILTTRPIDGWIRSFRRHVKSTYCWRVKDDPSFGIVHQTLFGQYGEEFWNNTEVVRKIYTDYVERVTGYFKGTDRLLILNVWKMSDEELWDSLSYFVDSIDGFFGYLRKTPFPKQTKPTRYYRFENLFGE